MSGCISSWGCVYADHLAQLSFCTRFGIKSCFPFHLLRPPLVTKAKSNFFTLSAAKHFPAVISCSRKCHLNIFSFLFINCLFISVNSDHFAVTVRISFLRSTPALKFYLSRCCTYRLRYAWICAYLSDCVHLRARVCTCACYCQYSQLEKTRGQECSSIGKLWSCSWHSALMVILERERNAERDYLHKDIRGTKNASDPSFLGPWSTWRECTVFIATYIT